MLESKLLDLRDCRNGRCKAIHDQILALQPRRQPSWFRPVFRSSPYIRLLLGFDHWSWAWEYPWAIEVAALDTDPLRILEVGGGGSPFAEYIADLGHYTYEADPSLIDGFSFVMNRKKGIARNVRSLAFHSLLRSTGINREWGLPPNMRSSSVHYYPYSAADLRFPDRSFDRVFCLSVIEHIPSELWRRCIGEFERVLRPGGRLVMTMDMAVAEANERRYRRLVEYCTLKLIGNPDYPVPITPEDQELRHPGHGFETIGLVWQA